MLAKLKVSFASVRAVPVILARNSAFHSLIAFEARFRTNVSTGKTGETFGMAVVTWILLIDRARHKDRVIATRDRLQHWLVANQFVELLYLPARRVAQNMPTLKRDTPVCDVHLASVHALIATSSWTKVLTALQRPHAVFQTEDLFMEKV